MKRNDAPLVIAYGLGTSPIGHVLAAVNPRGVCGLRLIEHESEREALAALRRAYPRAELIRDDQAVAHVIEHLRAFLSGGATNSKLRFDPKGTPFQQQVWRAMLKVPAGKTCSYQELACRAGRPRAVRAVAQACARNPIAILVPCHRIIAADGSLGGYGYGLALKQQLLEMERDD